MYCIYVWIFENDVNVNITTLTLFPGNTQDFSFNQPQTVCQHTAYSPTLLVSDWLAFGRRDSIRAFNDGIKILENREL